MLYKHCKNIEYYGTLNALVYFKDNSICSKLTNFKRKIPPPKCPIFHANS